MKQQEISQDTPYPLIAFSFRTFLLCMSSGHYCMEFFGLRMPPSDIPTSPAQPTVSLTPQWHSKPHLQYYRANGNTVAEIPVPAWTVNVMSAFLT